MKGDILELKDARGRELARVTRTRNRLYRTTMDVYIPKCLRVEEKEVTETWFSKLGHGDAGDNHEEVMFDLDEAEPGTFRVMMNDASDGYGDYEVEQAQQNNDPIDDSVIDGHEEENSVQFKTESAVIANQNVNRAQPQDMNMQHVPELVHDHQHVQHSGPESKHETESEEDDVSGHEEVDTTEAKVVPQQTEQPVTTRAGRMITKPKRFEDFVLMAEIEGTKLLFTIEESPRTMGKQQRYENGSK